MEHAMRKSATYFEQIPVQRVKEIVATLESQGVDSVAPSYVRTALQCRICCKPVPLETAKTDGYGKAVHEECYLVSLTQKTAVAGRTHPSR
jgi:hypothetical protein